MKQPRLTVDLAAVRHNVSCWREYLDGREIWAVVKSNAYGTGAVEIARATISAGASRLVVFDLAEAAPLRAAGISAPIIQVFATPLDELEEARRLGVVPSIESVEGIRALAAIASWRARRVPAHIAIDSGTGWSGVRASRAAELAARARSAAGVWFEGAWTHIASEVSMDAQMRTFATAVAAMRGEGLELPVVHAASTGPAVWGKSTGPVRIGIGLFGSTLASTKLNIALRTAIAVRAGVIAVKRFDAHTSIGYGGECVAEPGDVIATLRAGYADGLPKNLATGAGVAILRGEACRLAGAIGMNCTMVRLASEASATLGDEAFLVGEADGIRLDDIARSAGTIPHAVLTSLTAGMAVEYASRTA